MSSPTRVNREKDKARRVQNNENVMWTGVRTSGAGSTVNRITTPGDDYSIGDRQQSRSKPTAASSQQQRSPQNQVHMPIISGSQNTNVRNQYTRPNEPRFSETYYNTTESDRIEMTSSKRASKSKLKTVDYSEISMGMLKAQQQQNQNRRQSIENEFETLPIANARASGSIDTKFKQQIESMKAKERRNNAQLPPNIGQSYAQTPKQYQIQYAMPKNQAVHQSIGSDDPKRLQVSENILRDQTYTDKQGKLKTPNQISRRAPPFATNGPRSTKGSSGPGPNILLSMGGRQDASENISPRIPGGGPKGSFQSKDPNQTAYTTHASVGHGSELSNTPRGYILPKIGSANPANIPEARRTSQQPHRGRVHSTHYNKAEIQARRIFSSGEQPNQQNKGGQFHSTTISRAEQSTSQNQSSDRPQTNHGSVNQRFFKSNYGQSNQNRLNAVEKYKDTGFNWKKIDIRPRGVFGDQPSSSRASQKPHSVKQPPRKAPKRIQGMLPTKEERQEKERMALESRNATTPPPSYGEILSNLASSNKKMGTKIVSRREFDRLAAHNERDGVPMVEKTIFIVKPIYVQTDVPSRPKGKKKRAMTKKAIYTEKLKGPDYSQQDFPPKNQATTIKLKRKFKTHNRSIDDQATTPRGTQQRQTDLSLIKFKREASKELKEGTTTKERQRDTSRSKGAALNRTFQEEYKDRSLMHFQDSKMSNLSDFKNLLESSHIIDEIFHQRSIAIERSRELDQNRSQEIDNKSPSLHSQEVEGSPSNKSHKAKSPFRQSSQSPFSPKGKRARGRSSVGSQSNQSNPLLHAASVDGKHHPKIKEFTEKCNESLTEAGAGIQIIMQESKDAYFFQKKQIDMEKIAQQHYNQVRKWTVDHDTIEQTEAPDMMTPKARKEYEKLKAKELKTQKTASMLDKSGSIHNSQTDTKGLGGKSLGRFRDSRSGQQLSETRPNVAVHSTGQMPRDGDIHNRSAQEAADSFLHKSTSRSKEGKSMRTLNKSASPADGRSNVNIVDQNQSKMTKATIKEDRSKNQLTHERVHALRLFTKDLKDDKVQQPKKKSIPVEVENQFCSHISPKVSAHLIQANDLNALDDNNPYRFWADRDRKTREEHFNPVPKHFYTNYKTNLMRDAHEVAKVVAAEVSDGGKECDHMNQCDCKNAENNKLHRLNLKNQWKSRLKMSKKERKDSRQTSYELHKPYRPCRRSCSSTHNPLFHAQRMHNEHLQRLHQSATKLMIMSVIPERPKSVDSAEEARKEYLREIDYTGSIMYSEVLRRKSIKEGKKGGGNVENILEKGEDEENEEFTLKMPGGSQGKRSKLSNLELAGQESSISINRGMMDAENEHCYSPIEIEYLMHLLKNKSAIKQASKEHNLDSMYTKARKTLKVHMKKLLLKRQFYHIDAQYKLAENEKQTAANILKLLTRCQKMHEAQSEITKILILVHSRMDKHMTLKMDLRTHVEDENVVKIIKKLYTELVRISSRIFIAIQTLKDNEKALHRPFIFARNQYDEDWMHKQMKKIRLRILKLYPNLQEAPELRMFFTKAGDVSDVRKLNKAEFEQDSEDADSSSSSDEAEDSIGKLDQDSINYGTLNDRSEYGRHSQQ